MMQMEEIRMKLLDSDELQLEFDKKDVLSVQAAQLSKICEWVLDEVDTLCNEFSDLFTEFALSFPSPALAFVLFFKLFQKK